MPFGSILLLHISIFIKKKIKIAFHWSSALHFWRLLSDKACVVHICWDFFLLIFVDRVVNHELCVRWGNSFGLKWCGKGKQEANWVCRVRNRQAASWVFRIRRHKLLCHVPYLSIKYIYLPMMHLLHLGPEHITDYKKLQGARVSLSAWISFGGAVPLFPVLENGVFPLFLYNRYLFTFTFPPCFIDDSLCHSCCVFLYEG